jgi:hypothetical protein
MICYVISVIFKSKMSIIKTLTRIDIHLQGLILLTLLILSGTACNGNRQETKGNLSASEKTDPARLGTNQVADKEINAILVIPENPKPGERFRILAAGNENIRKAQIIVSGPAGSSESIKSKTGDEMPYWRIDDFAGCPAGKYKVTLLVNRKVTGNLDFKISQEGAHSPSGVIWKTLRGWDSKTEAIYSAWVNALFKGCDENKSWTSLDQVTSDQNQNFLYNCLSLGEDDPDGKTSVLMRPDCADNPFFLRAYFAWKLGLPFGYHLCDRGSLVKNPRTGQWITNETPGQKTDAILAFNAFLRRVADGVHSGTARTALDDEKSDYYPVSLEKESLRPGIVFADPYGHTLVLVGRLAQTKEQPGLLLAVDAQPDGTVGIKRFWKGNFLFNTSGVIGEAGFKAFRPISYTSGTLNPMRNSELTSIAGFVPFSLQQRKMETEAFYHIMERVINPDKLDPETALLGLIKALYEQLLVRITSVANGEVYFKSHPGAVIPMPSSAAGIFQTGGIWEDYSTPNRDLRLLIAMDAVLGFPDLVSSSPEDFNISGLISPERLKNKLQSILEQKTSELTISYTRSDGSSQKLTVGEILKRREAFEIAYNPNDGTEIRWGAPENSVERQTCHRHSPTTQLEKMKSVRSWFTRRLHPPT